MIEIIKQQVKMPEVDKRRFQMWPKDINGKRWNVFDTSDNSIRYCGKFEEASLACHNLNKKFYLNP